MDGIRGWGDAGPVTPTDGVSVEVDSTGGSAAVSATRGSLSAEVQVLGAASDATALDASGSLTLARGRVSAGVRTTLSGALAGTTLAKVGYASSVDEVGPFEATWAAAVGAASLPDLRARLIDANHDALGYPVGGSDASLTAAVLAASGGVQLKPLTLAPGLRLEGALAAGAVAFAPIEHDAATREQIAETTNGASGVDVGAVAGLSRLSVRARAGLTFDEGNLHARAELSAHSNVMDDPTFALAHGSPAALLTRYAFTERAVDASVRLDSAHLAVSAHVPLATTEDDAARIAVEAQLRELTTRAAWSAGASSKVAVEAELPLGPAFRVGARAESDLHGGFTGMLTLSYSPDGAPPRISRGMPDATRPNARVPSRWNVSLPPGIRSMGYAEALAALDTPEKVSAFLNPANRDAGALAYLPHNDDWSKWTPEETFARGGGICADLHLFGAAALQQHGYEAYDVQLMARTLAHDVIAYRDRDGGWNVLQYGQIFDAHAPDPLSAVRRVFPDAMELQVVDPSTMRTVRAEKTPWAGALSDYFGA